MVFPISLKYKFNNFDLDSFRKALLRYEFDPDRTYFVQLFAISGETLGAPIPFSVVKPFSLIKINNGIMKPLGETVKVEDDKVEGFDFKRDLYYKIRTILSYVSFEQDPSKKRSSFVSKCDKNYYYDFIVSIREDLPLNNILLVNSSSNK